MNMIKINGHKDNEWMYIFINNQLIQNQLLYNCKNKLQLLLALPQPFKAEKHFSNSTFEADRLKTTQVSTNFKFKFILKNS